MVIPLGNIASSDPVVTQIETGKGVDGALDKIGTESVVALVTVASPNTMPGIGLRTETPCTKFVSVPVTVRVAEELFGMVNWLSCER